METDMLWRRRAEALFLLKCNCHDMSPFDIKQASLILKSMFRLTPQLVAFWALSRFILKATHSTYRAHQHMTYAHRNCENTKSSICCNFYDMFSFSHRWCTSCTVYQASLVYLKSALVHCCSTRTGTFGMTTTFALERVPYCLLKMNSNVRSFVESPHDFRCFIRKKGYRCPGLVNTGTSSFGLLVCWTMLQTTGEKSFCSDI